MSCILNRNTQGKITGAQTLQGEASQLFEAIHSNPFLGEAETSANILSAAYTPEIQKKFAGSDKYVYSTGEPMLFYQSNNGIETEDIEKAILNDSPGMMSIGFKDPATDEFIPVVRFNTDASDKSRFIWDQVQQGVLSAARVLGEDGITHMQGKGEFPETRRVTATMFKYNAMIDMGIGNIKVSEEGLIDIEFPSDIQLEIIESAEDKSLSLIEKALNNRPLKLERTEAPKTNTKDLSQSLYNFLESLGFTKTSLQAYREKYKTKFGTDPDIQALADIANRVVAFGMENVPVDILSEEVAHIAIEAYSDQNSIVSALANVHLSPEYNEFQAYYRQKYAAFSEGVELEEQVRKEILGKILAKQFQNRFQTRAVTEEQAYLLGKIREIWNNFVEYIRQFIKAPQRAALDRLNRKIADSVFQSDLTQFSNKLGDNTNFFYNAMSTDSRKTETTLKKAKKAIEDLFSATGKKAPKESALNKIADLMTEVNILSSVNTITGIVEKQLGILEANVKETKNKRLPISEQDESIFNAITNDFIPLLESLRSDINKLDLADPKHQQIVSGISKTISEIVDRHSNIRPEMDDFKEELVDKIVSEAYDDTNSNLSPEARQREKGKITGAINIKDRSFAARHFGLMTNSENPVLQLAARVVTSMYVKSRAKILEHINPVVDDIYKNNLARYQKDLIHKYKGKKTHYFFGPVNWAKIDEEELDKKIEVASKLTGKEADLIRKEQKTKTFAEIIGSAENYEQYEKEMKEYVQSRNQRFYKKAYYDNKKDKFDKLKISEETRETISNFSARRFEILSKYRNPDGTIDKSALSEADKKAMADLKRDREIVKSIYDVFGNTKEGLKSVRLEDLSSEEVLGLEEEFGIKVSPKFKGEFIVLQRGQKLEDLNEESRLTIDMSNMALKYAQELEEKSRSKDPSEAFNEMVRTQGDNAFDWVMANATIGLNDQYFENLGVSVTYEDMVAKYIDSLETPALKDDVRLRLNEYKELSRKRKNLLKQNRQQGNPLEIDVRNMPTNIRDAITDLDSKISDIRSSISLPKEFYQEGQFISERGVNDHFYKMVRESGLSEYEFAKKHMTEENRLRTEKFAWEISALINGKRKYISTAFEEFFQEMVDNGVVDGSMSSEELISTLSGEYAKTKVASYFQRYTPNGYETFVQAMQANGNLVSEMISNRSAVVDRYPVARYLEITPDYSWLEDVATDDNNEEGPNPYYKTGGYWKKSLAEDLNDEWFDFFGISKDDYLNLPTDDISELTATKNLPQFELLKKLVKMREDSIAKYGDEQKVNKWLLVQQRSRIFEKIVGANATNLLANVKDLANDIVRNRTDEQEYGAQFEGEDLMMQGFKKIPKFYQLKVEDPEEITENLIGAAIMDYQQAALYEERRVAENSMNALAYKVQKQQFISNGGKTNKSRILKTGATTMYAESFQEYMGHHIYGIQQTRAFKTVILGKEVDLTQAVSAVQKMAQLANLGYNLFVDLTGLTTGALSNITDRWVGDYYHKDSARTAWSQVRNLMREYTLEFGEVNKTSKLSAMLEFFDITDIDYRFQNTQMSKAARIIQRSPYVGSKASNMGVTPAILFSVLNDFRYSDGAFRSFNEFAAYKRFQNPDISNVSIEAEWRQLEAESFYNNLNIKSQKISYNDKFASKFENPKEEFEKLHIKITAKAKAVVQLADGVLSEVDRVSAQRDFLANLVMMHRGWLPIALTKRFKKGGFNLSTGNFEEGHYRTLGKIIQNALSRSADKKSFAQAYRDLTPEQKRNVKRSAIETGLLTTALLLGLIVLAGDDEDDTWAENLGQLIFLRTTSEYASGHVVGIPGSLIDAVKSPVTTISTLELFEPISLISSVYEYDSEDNNKLLRKIEKATVLKRLGQYSDLQKQIEAFRHFNTRTLFWLGEEKKED